jgi:hypothetical protein
VEDYAAAKSSDTVLFGRFFHALDIDETVRAMAEVLTSLRA